MPKREAWIYRAAAATAMTLVLCFGFTVLWVEFYHYAEGVAPQWMLEEVRGRRWRGTWLEHLFVGGYFFILLPGGAAILLTLFWLFRVPFSGALPGESAVDYPFKEHPKTLRELAENDPRRPF